MMGSLATWVLMLLPVMPATRLACWLLPRTDRARLLFAALWLYAIVIQTQVIALGLAGLLTLPWALALGVAAALGALALPAGDQRFDPVGWLRQFFADATPPERVALVALALGPLYALLRLAGDGPYFMWDDWAYHGKVVTDMMRTDSIAFFHNNFAMYYPFNPHLLSFYTTLGSGDLRWVWLPTVYWQVVGAVAWIVLARGAPRRCLEFFLLAGAVFGLSQEVRWFQNAFCSTDVIGAVGLFSAFAVARPREDADDAEVRANALLCGLIIGYTIGTKNFFVVPAVGAALTCVYWSTLGRPAVTNRWVLGAQTFGLGLLGVWISGSFWYLRNLLIAGNPVFPVKVLGFDGPMKPKHFANTTFMHFGRRAGWDWDFWRDALTQWLMWPEPHGVMLNLGLLGGVVVCVVAGWRLVAGKGQRPVPIGALPGMVAGAAILLLAYPHLPYSGTFIGTDYLVVSRRYLLFCFIAALAFWAYFAGTGLRSGRVVSRVLRVVFYLLLALEWPVVVWYREYVYLAFLLLLPGPPYVGFKLLETENALAWQVANNWPDVGWDVYGLTTALVGLVVAAVVRLVPGRVQRLLDSVAPARIAVGGAVCLLLLGLLAGRSLWFEAPSYRTFYPRWDTTKLARLGNAVDHLPEGSRVGGLGATSWEQWFLHGSRGQLEPVYLNGNGRPLPQLHEAFARGLINPDDTDTPPRSGVPFRNEFPRPDLFAERLAEGRLDFLILTKYIGNEWPPQREAVAALPDWQRVWEDGYSEIYQHLDAHGERPVSFPPMAALEQRPPRGAKVQP